MKNYWNWILSSLLLVFPALYGAAPGPIVTIYNSDLGLVQEFRTIEMTRGRQVLLITDIPEKILPSSVHLTAQNENPFRLIEQDYQYDLVDADKLFDKNIGSELNLNLKDGTVLTATLLSRDGELLILRTEADSLLMVNTAHLRTLGFPAIKERLVLKPTLKWILECMKPGRYPVEFSYLTEGLSWRAEYILLLSHTNGGSLRSWVTLTNNSGKTYRDTEIKLVAGDIHRVRKNQEPGIRRTMMMDRAESQQGVAQREVFEYHLYQLGEVSTLQESTVKQVAFRESVPIEYQRTYTFAHRERNTVEQENVEIQVVFENTESNNLGLPLPGGLVRLMQVDDGGREVLIGEDHLRHTPAEAEIRLTAGKAFDVLGDREISEYERRGNDYERWSVKLSLQNHKESPVSVEVVEHYYGDWEVLKSSVEYNRKSAGMVQFQIRIPPNDEYQFEYTVERRFS